MIGENIKKIRERLNLSQAEFAERITVSQKTVSNMESGQVTEKNLIAICRVFNVNEKFLRDGEGKMFHESMETILNDSTLDETDRAILQAYISIPPSERKYIKEWIIKTAEKIKNQE